MSTDPRPTRHDVLSGCEALRELVDGTPLSPWLRRRVISTVCDGIEGGDWSPGLGALTPIVATMRSSGAMARLVDRAGDGTLTCAIAQHVSRMLIDILACRWPRPLVRDPVWSSAIDAAASGLGSLGHVSNGIEESLGTAFDDPRLKTLAEQVEGALEALEVSIDAATEALDVLEDLLPGKGHDSTVRELRREVLGNLEDHARLITNVPELKRIAELMGRMTSETESRSTRSPRGRDEVHSLTRSADLVRVLPSELCNLGDERLRTLFMSRYVEGRLMTYMMRGDELVDGPPLRGGPVVALIDTSGSMAGERESMAKALLLVLARRMASDGRPLRAVLFSTATVSIDLSPGEGAGSRLLEFLSLTFGGGTDFNAALNAGLEGLRSEDMRMGDLLFVTDGFSRLTDAHLLHEWESLKAERDARVFTVIIGEDDPGGLRALSDVVYTLGSSGYWNGRSPELI